MNGSSIHRLVHGGRGSLPIAVQIVPRYPITESLLSLAQEQHWQLISLDTFDYQLPMDLVVRGALVTEPGKTSGLVPELLRRNVPTVRIGWHEQELDQQLPAVLSDQAAIGQLAAEHFAQRDFKHVLFLKHPTWANLHSIYHAFAQRAEQLGMTCYLRRLKGPPAELGVLRDTDAWHYRQEFFTRLLRKLPMPMGLLASSDITASRYSRWVLEAGLRVPEDVAVLGIGNDRFVCECAQVPLSAVVRDWPRVTAAAVHMLATLLAGQPLDERTMRIPPRGVATRQSTDVLAATDPRVVKALRFMWDHVQENLSVDQIARHVGVTRRTLERAFERDLGRGINQEFQRRRLDKARELILQTDLPVSRIAEALSFSSQTYFGRVFRDAYQLSPSEYRQQARALP